MHGIYYQKNKPLDLYRSHFWHSFFSEEDRSPFAAVYSSLGCKFGCNFCMINILNRTTTNDDAKSSDYKIMSIGIQYISLINWSNFQILG